MQSVKRKHHHLEKSLYIYMHLLFFNASHVEGKTTYLKDLVFIYPQLQNGGLPFIFYQFFLSSFRIIPALERVKMGQ